MRRIVLSLSLFFTLCLFSDAQAALELELTQGINSALPISVSTFNMSSEFKTDVAEVVRSDLQYSGYFRLVNGVQGKLGDALQHDAWKRQGADYFVLGRVTRKQGDQLSVSFQLHEAVGSRQMLLNKVFNVREGDLRALSHHISDLVYEALTGDKGIFSTRIAYISVHQQAGRGKFRLEVADADGYNPRTLLMSSEPIMSPSWSPDGKRLAYVSFEHKKAEVYQVNVATGGRSLVTSFPGINNAPAWSPDGRKLALVLSKSGVPKIYQIDLASKQLSQLTDGSSIDTEPAWSADGRSLFFTSNRGGSPQIYRYDFASRGVQRVSFSGNYNARSSVTPNGRTLVMQHRNGGSFNIAVLDLPSGRTETLTRQAQDESPSLSPNGKMVLYATRYGSNGVLSVVSVDGRVRMRLPAREGDVQEPAWSPFLG